MQYGGLRYAECDDDADGNDDGDGLHASAHTDLCNKDFAPEEMNTGWFWNVLSGCSLDQKRLRNKIFS